MDIDDVHPPPDRELGRRRNLIIERHEHHHNGGNGNSANRIVWASAAFFGITLVGIGAWNTAKTAQLAEEVAGIKATLNILVQERGRE